MSKAAFETGGKVPEQNLFVAVLEQSLIDSNYRIKKPHEKPKLPQHASEEDIKAHKKKLYKWNERNLGIRRQHDQQNAARRWLMGNSEALITICKGLGTDINVIHQAVWKSCRWAQEQYPRPFTQDTEIRFKITGD